MSERESYIIGVSSFNVKSMKQSMLELKNKLIMDAINDALINCKNININLKSKIDGLLSLKPSAYMFDNSIKNSLHYYGTWLASKLKLIKPGKKFVSRTMDCGGTTPIALSLHARQLIKNNECDLIAVVMGECLNKVPRVAWKSSTKIRKPKKKENNDGFNKLFNEQMTRDNQVNKITAGIPYQYDKYTQLFLDNEGKKYGITRYIFVYRQIINISTECFYINILWYIYNIEIY